MKILTDLPKEASVLGTILKNGKDAFVDADSILSVGDFSSRINQVIYTSLKSLNDDPQCGVFDAETIKMKAHSIGFKDFFNDPKQNEYLENLEFVNFDKSNVIPFALYLKKYSVARELHSRYTNAAKYLEGISGEETLSDIINNTETKVLDIINGIDNGDLEKIGQDIESYVEKLIEQEPVTQIGIPSGFPQWEKFIGGGGRKGTINIIGARSKVGKSWMLLNMARNIAKLGIKVLYLDTEMLRDAQRNRLLSIDSGCPLSLLETGKFKQSDDLKEAVLDSSKRLSHLPFDYKSISDIGTEEAILYARRWLNRETKNGEEVALMWDYVKITNAADLKSYNPEYVALGFFMIQLQQLACKYQIPIYTAVQFNRDALLSDDTGVIAGSDRILHIASNISGLKNKSDEDVERGFGYEFGNKKLWIMDCRSGPGMAEETDYISIYAKIGRGVPENEACGHFREGSLYSSLVQGHA